MKRLNEFSVLGGPPTFPEPLVVGMPSMPDRVALHQRIDEMLDRRQLTNDGEFVRTLESRLQDEIGCRHVVCVCNGTMALQILAQACQLKGEVIVPAMTFVATPHALDWIGLKPVFADVDQTYHTLDPQSVERCVSPNTRAILGVHLWGNVCPIRELQDIADRHDLKLLFDASQAFGCSYHGRTVGQFGLGEAISFHATKVFHCVEGGAILTNDQEIADRCRLMRNFGITGYREIRSAGINGKMNEMTAAVGLTSLTQVRQLIEGNQRRRQAYLQVLDRIPGIRLSKIPDEDCHNSQYVVVTIDHDELGLDRNQLLKILRAEGIFARSYFEPGCHNAAPYRDDPSTQPVPLATTNRLLAGIMQLPTGPAVTLPDIERIGQLLEAVFDHRHALRDALAAESRGEHQHDPENGWTEPHAA